MTDSRIPAIKIAKALADAGVASRRKAEELVLAGKVRVNGKPLRNVAERVIPGKDAIAVNGQLLRAQDEPNIILALNKPRGVISTVSDPDGKPTIMEYIPEKFSQYRLFPVGRLDEDSEGILLLTNDGQYAYELTHPKFQVPKTYHVLISGQLSESELQRVRRGVPLKGRKTQPAQIKILERLDESQLLEITIHEGLHRQVRRMMQALNHNVLRLQRVQFGPYSLGKLAVGEVREEKKHSASALFENPEDDANEIVGIS